MKKNDRHSECSLFSENVRVRQIEPPVLTAEGAKKRKV